MSPRRAKVIYWVAWIFEGLTLLFGVFALVFITAYEASLSLILGYAAFVVVCALMFFLIQRYCRNVLISSGIQPPRV
jgi:uncharacterized membrane protein